MSPDGVLPEIIELPGHPWFIGVQYHPELKSKPFDAAPAVRRVHCGGGASGAAGVGAVGAGLAREPLVGGGNGTDNFLAYGIRFR